MDRAEKAGAQKAGAEKAGGGGGADGRDAGGEAVRRRVTVVNRRGLHARAAAKFVRLAGRFEARVTVCRAGTEVGGDSIMGLMMLAAGPGVEIELTARGPQAREAVDALEGLIVARFDED